MTIKDISEALNISISTVSKALNDATDIAEETKLMVRKYAESMGYRLKTRQTSRRICALYERVDSDTRNNILTHVFTAFNDIAVANNFEVITDTIASKPEGFNLNDYLKSNNLCAAFIVGMKYDSPVYKQLRKTSVPIVLMDNRVSDSPMIASVSSDNTAAIVRAVKHLAKLGHEKIGLIMGEKNSLVSAERLAGYVLGLAQANLDFNFDYVYQGDYTKASGEQAAEFFCDTDVTAVISCSDFMAMGLIDGLTSQGKRVPQDFSVIGFDDIHLLKYTNYNLTTMKQDFVQMGEQAFRQISEMLAGRSSQQIMLGCQLIERGSVLDMRKK